MAVAIFEARDLVQDGVRLLELIGIGADGKWLALDCRESLAAIPQNVIELDSLEGFELVRRYSKHDGASV